MPPGDFIVYRLVEFCGANCLDWGKMPQDDFLVKPFFLGNLAVQQTVFFWFPMQISRINKVIHFVDAGTGEGVVGKTPSQCSRVA
ncbi:MAG: hypothetical protein OEL83_01930 [Desulforhopalus sp.]|nr:hypothetical protein [Desulforhopalus sp.]